MFDFPAPFGPMIDWKFFKSPTTCVPKSLKSEFKNWREKIMEWKKI